MRGRPGILATIAAALGLGAAFNPAAAAPVRIAKTHNGGQRTGAADHKRAATRRNNIRKNPRGAR